MADLSAPKGGVLNAPVCAEMARHFGTELGTPKPAVFALEAATSVRSNSLFEPMMRSSFASISTRWASARR